MSARSLPTSTPVRAGASGDWSSWADVFTENATYIEHNFGVFHGREQIREWMTGIMSQFPGKLMDDFPAAWCVIDEERGWVICELLNRMKALP